MAGLDTELDILERILDGQEKPRRLELALLRTITENFSDARIIGSGGCGDVYKGVLRNGTVAVKKLFKTRTIDEKMFNHEVHSMMTVKHENIVQFLGYCSDTQGQSIEIGGKRIMGDVRERLLCFEHIKNGSLKKHIKDELRGLKWHERYKIIKGICKGLHHLHKEKRIRHMDLKPDNILLGDHLVPKITDFGLARLDEKSQTTSEQRLLSPGYCAPEYRDHGRMSAKSDIYSLGVIILELVTGSKEDPDIAKVLRRWRHRWNKSSEDTPLLWYRQVAKCLDLTQWCKQNNPIDRPNIWDIISELNEIDSWDGQIRYAAVTTFDKIMSCLEDILGIEPLEMHFPFVLNEPISCSILVNNSTDDYFAFRIASTSLLPFSTQPDKGIVEPRTKLSATVTLEAQDKALPQNHYSEEFVVQSSRINGIPTSTEVTKDMFNDVVGGAVDEVNLTVVFDMPPTPKEHQIDIDSLKYQEPDNAPDESHSRADNGSLGASSQVNEGPRESMASMALDDPRYKDVHALERILHGSESPRKLKFSLLEFITKKFSDSRRINVTPKSIGKDDVVFADIYKGILRNGGIVAVKNLHSNHTIDDKIFHQEVKTMMRVEHQNIVRFLGYCSHTEEQAVEMNGRFILAEERKRLLCFEYISNGSLKDHLTDELRGHEWHTRYQILEGICEALLHLHKEKHILHMNLKPSKILLDDQMVPKVADFSLSRLDDKSQTVSSERAGTLGYTAPEYMHYGKMSAKSDIYSLGNIIRELVTGTRDDANITNVLRRWRHRWNKSSNDTPLLWYRQVAKCLDLTKWCKRKNPLDRPNIWDIISELNEIESWDGQIRYATVSTFDKIMSCLEDMLDIEPLEMHFLFAVDEPMSCSIAMNNDTDDYFAFRIASTSLLPFSIQPDKGIVEPQSMLSATVTLQALDKALLQNHCNEEFSVQSFRIDGIPTSTDVTKDMLDDVVGKIVDEVKLTVVFDLPPAPEEDHMYSMKYQEPDNASGEPHSRANNMTQVYMGPRESTAPMDLDDPRYQDVHVLERILDGRETPRNLKFSLLESITENFSDSRKIGVGTFATVYKGTLRHGIVAVRKLFFEHTLEDGIFLHEVESTMKFHHRNIVRLLGYCSHTEEHAVEYQGRIVLAQERERLLCFEYMSNGSLEDHLTDELRGPEWHTRYQILEGICEAVLYLHKEKHSIHMNLKPSNILLDDQMVPKVSDFFLSRLDDKTHTRSSLEHGGTLRYSAPEYVIDGKMSAKSDIYSLGTIIRELVAGTEAVTDITKVEVLRKWRYRWNKSENYTPLWAQQVSKCLELAERCTSECPINRPFIWDVIRELGESDQISLNLDDLMLVHQDPEVLSP